MTSDNLDIPNMVALYGKLDRERDEMCRDIDGAIDDLEVQITKLRGDRKRITQPIDTDIVRLETQIGEALLATREKVRVGNWSFTYINRTKFNFVRLKEDLELHPILGEYVTQIEYVQKRRVERRVKY